MEAPNATVVRPFRVEAPNATVLRLFRVEAPLLAMATNVEGPPPLDTKADYDGRSLLDVVVTQGYKRPTTWPPTDEPLAVVEVTTTPASAPVDDSDRLLLPYGVTIAGHDTGIYQTT